MLLGMGHGQLVMQSKKQHYFLLYLLGTLYCVTVHPTSNKLTVTHAKQHGHGHGHVPMHRVQTDARNKRTTRAGCTAQETRDKGTVPTSWLNTTSSWLNQKTA